PMTSSNGYGTLTFSTRNTVPSGYGGAKVSFGLGSGGGSASATIPHQTSWTTYKISVAMTASTTNASVTFSLCNSEDYHLDIDNVSICWTSDNQTTLSGTDSDNICNSPVCEESHGNPVTVPYDVDPLEVLCIDETDMPSCPCE